MQTSPAASSFTSYLRRTGTERKKWPSGIANLARNSDRFYLFFFFRKVFSPPIISEIFETRVSNLNEGDGSHNRKQVASSIVVKDQFIQAETQKARENDP